MVRNFLNYIKILRVGHWPKQIFLIPGFIYAILISNYSEINYSNQTIFLNIAICFLITNFASSANYCINEYLDSQYDKHHPLKKNRPSVKNEINPIILMIIHFKDLVYRIIIFELYGKIYIFIKLDYMQILKQLQMLLQ